MLVGLWREHLEQAGAGGGHGQRIAVVGADLIDRAVSTTSIDLLGAADRAGGKTATKGLGEGDHIRLDTELLGRAASGDAEAGFDLVEDQTMPCSSVISRTDSR